MNNSLIRRWFDGLKMGSPFRDDSDSEHQEAQSEEGTSESQKIKKKKKHKKKKVSRKETEAAVVSTQEESRGLFERSDFIAGAEKSDDEGAEWEVVGKQKKYSDYPSWATQDQVLPNLRERNIKWVKDLSIRFSERKKLMTFRDIYNAAQKIAPEEIEDWRRLTEALRPHENDNGYVDEVNKNRCVEASLEVNNLLLQRGDLSKETAAKIHLAQAKTYNRIGRSGQREKHLSYASEIDPDNMSVKVFKADCLRGSLGSMDAAIEIYKEVLNSRQGKDVDKGRASSGIGLSFMEKARELRGQKRYVKGEKKTFHDDESVLENARESFKYIRNAYSYFEKSDAVEAEQLLKNNANLGLKSAWELSSTIFSVRILPAQKENNIKIEDLREGLNVIDQGVAWGEKNDSEKNREVLGLLHFNGAHLRHAGSYHMHDDLMEGSREEAIELSLKALDHIEKGRILKTGKSENEWQIREMRNHVLLSSLYGLQGNMEKCEEHADKVIALHKDSGGLRCNVGLFNRAEEYKRYLRTAEGRGVAWVKEKFEERLERDKKSKSTQGRQESSSRG